MKKLDIQQRSPEWHALRANSIGGSDAPIIAGISPYRTALQLWQEKLGLIPPQQINYAMQRGIEKEDYIRNQFIIKTGFSVFPCVVQHESIPYMIASLDGLSEDEMICCELKFNGAKNHFAAKADQIATDHYCQMQHQMFVTGLKDMFYLSYDGKESCVKQVFRDEKYIKKLIKMEKAFYECLQTIQPPKTTDIESTEILSETWLSTAKHYLSHKKSREFHEEMEQKYKEKLIELSNGVDSHGAGIKITSSMRKGSIDYKNIPELKDINIEKYRGKPVVIWKISTL